MSLKAKIEAVIYAAEEPVTLAQLAALFQVEVLEAKQARLSAEAASREAEAIAEIAPADITTDTTPEGATDAGVVTESLLALEEPTVAAEEFAPPETTGDAAAIAPTPVEPLPVEPTIEDEKRAARQRDREIREELRLVVEALIAEYDSGDRGIEIREIAGGFRMATRAEYHDAVRGFVKSLKPVMKLSLQALETLAVIAYKQPVTAPEVSEIRGVDSGGVLGSLIGRKLITTAGRKQVIGRPILYKTTKEFLLRFGLKDLNELPSIEEFEKMAGELAETESLDAPAEQMSLAQGEEPGEVPEEESEAAAAIRAHDDSETHAAAVAAIAISDETAEHHDAGDLPGIAVEAHVKPSELVDAGEATAAVGQPGEGD
jgi:segregation and condensation protein B